ncbi:MAG: DUF4405 domain-containing protein [Chloroflexi bacterium]|nr:DUF4405 domain-containing protein [Chloroflexota bacterium]
MSTKTNLILDVTIFTAFLLASNPAITGLPIHEWFSLAFTAALVTHLLFHWKWIVSLTKAFFKKLFHSSRLNYGIDSLLFVAMTAAMLSGLLISKSILATFGIQLEVGRAWRSIHSLSADASLILVALHFAMHWNWMITSLERYLVAPLTSFVQRPANRPTRQLAAQPVRFDLEK